MKPSNEEINVRYWMPLEGEEQPVERDYFTDLEEDIERIDDINTFKVEGLEHQHASVAEEFARALQERLGFSVNGG